VTPYVYKQCRLNLDDIDKIYEKNAHISAELSREMGGAGHPDTSSSQ